MDRLDKILSEYGNVSRSEARALIKSGAVLVNDTPATGHGQKIEDGDLVFLNGKVLDREKYAYYMMNKPAGVICATQDNNCETVLDLLPKELRRKGLFPAGRLDKDTEGFVLITNDGGFAHKMLSPKSHVPKKYFARLNAPIPEGAPEIFALGLDLGGGDICSPAKLQILSEDALEASLIIYEGMFHQVKRMFKKLGVEVIYLKRISIGELILDPDLPPGGYRKILYKELEKIQP